MSENLGLGAMISMLSGNRESVEAFVAAKGKTLARVEMLKEGDGALRLDFTDGTAIELYDDARSCCESRWLSTDDDLTYHVGATLENAEVLGGPTTDADGDPTESAFLHITTSKGKFTVNAYNSHNGYYGGISFRARNA